MAEELGIPVVSSKNAAEEAAGGPRGRGPDEIALELTKFIAATTGYGRSSTGPVAGFSGKPAARSPEEYAEALLQLFERCREVVKKGQ
jgi:hypothetical protein